MNLKGIKHFILISLLGMSSVFAENTERLMPSYLNDLDFSYYSSQRGTSFYSREFNIFYTQRAVHQCQFSENDIRDKLNSLNFWANLENAIPMAKEKWISLDVTIAIDDFATLYPSRSSYFLEHFPTRGKHIIGLDCRLLKTPLLASKIAHEMVHAFLQPHQLPIWLEEMIAQTVESDFNLDYLKNAKAYIAKMNYFPNPLLNKKPFSGSDRYALNLLLSEYLRQAFFKSHFWRDLLTAAPTMNPRNDFSSAELFSFARKKSKTAPTWVPRRLDEKTILIHFYLALALNQQDQNQRGVFKIDGWQGFQTPPLKSLKAFRDGFKLESSSALRLDFQVAKALFSQNKSMDKHLYEIFIIESSFNEFRITEAKNLDWSAYVLTPEKTYQVLFINWAEKFHF